KAAEAGVQGLPARHLPGHRDRESAALQTFGARHAVVEIAVLAGARWRPLAKIERERRAAGEAAEREAPTTHAARRPMHDAARRRRRPAAAGAGAAPRARPPSRSTSAPASAANRCSAATAPTRASAGRAHASGRASQMARRSIPGWYLAGPAAANACRLGRV